MVSAHFQINKKTMSSRMSSRMATVCVPCSSHRWAGRSDIQTLCLRTQDTALPGPRRMCTPSPLKSHLPHTHTVSLPCKSPLIIISAVFFKRIINYKKRIKKKIQIRVILSIIPTNMTFYFSALNHFPTIYCSFISTFDSLFSCECDMK